MLIRIPNWLGDAIMATPVFENLYPFERLILFGPSLFLELFEDLPNTFTIAFERGNLRANLSSLRPFREERGLLLTNSFSSALLFFLARIRERIGYSTDLRGFLLTKRIRPPKEKLHQRDKYLYLLERLGYRIYTKELKIHLSQNKLERAHAFLRDIKLEPEKDSLVVFAPGANYGPAKRWPEGHFRELASKLTSQGFKVLVVGSPQEFTLCEKISDNLKGVYNLCGKVSLGILTGILKFSKVLISNDSGLMHLGSALKIPQIAIFGSTDPQATGPLNPKARVIRKTLPCAPCFKRTCPEGHYQCLTTIDPTEVYEEILTLLQK